MVISVGVKSNRQFRKRNFEPTIEVASKGYLAEILKKEGIGSVAKIHKQHLKDTQK